VFYAVVEMGFPDREAVKSWLLATHYGRRSYSAEMKAYVRGTDYLPPQEAARGRPKKSKFPKWELENRRRVV
jgi:hypothetical protein